MKDLNNDPWCVRITVEYLLKVHVVGNCLRLVCSSTDCSRWSLSYLLCPFSTEILTKRSSICVLYCFCYTENEASCKLVLITNCNNHSPRFVLFPIFFNGDLMVDFLVVSCQKQEAMDNVGQYFGTLLINVSKKPKKKTTPYNSQWQLKTPTIISNIFLVDILLVTILLIHA